ncbi:uncharacterized protein LOC114366551 isoform X2 [Ostrinia furnacalis]|uniref:uncharacterized protein LOC114366551 isoform X1 n=1 Tax=Ostrinia furnacalis TaxID=93504 RepID=UPI00103BD680|nr:uncharacterized protein LOC114366551 isoform X1 [Ostrinia furnacalis]XP_028179267.1 uncharacterized protein LOC114366551 isoform X2 [Ostrinia furnacalis]
MAEHDSSETESECDTKEFVETRLPDTNDQLFLKEFIEKMEVLPGLWDTSSPFYTNLRQRRKAMEELLVIYKQIKPRATIDDVRKKLNSLRSNYRKEVRRIASSKLSAESEDDVYKPKSWVFYALHFLGKIKPKSTTSQEKEQERGNEDSPPPIKITRTIPAMLIQNVHNSLPTYIIPQSNSKPSSFPLPQLISPTTNTGNTSKSVLNPTPIYRSQVENKDPVMPQLRLISPTPQPSNSTKTIINPTAIYWSHKLDNIKDPTQKLFAEKYINEILFQAQLGNLAGPPVIHTISDNK